MTHSTMDDADPGDPPDPTAEESSTLAQQHRLVTQKTELMPAEQSASEPDRRLQRTWSVEEARRLRAALIIALVVLERPGVAELIAADPEVIALLGNSVDPAWRARAWWLTAVNELQGLEWDLDEWLKKADG